jgi:GTP cyclohydrolase I
MLVTATVDGATAPVLLPPKPVDIDGVEHSTRALLVALGQGAKDEVMQSTPRRVAELYVEAINPSYVDVEVPPKTFENPGVDGLITVSDVHYVSLCEHHLAPSFGVAHVGYVPATRVVGYSKLKKALNYVSRQPQLNERILVDVLNFIEEHLQPRGVAVVLRSTHCCISLRANAPATEVVTISGHRGVLRSDPFRSEFLSTWTSSPPKFGA